MYILIEFTKYYGGKTRMAFENFQDLKNTVDNDLAKCGYEHKKSVDLRSIKSCIYFITRDGWNTNFKLSKDFKKYLKYKYGD